MSEGGRIQRPGEGRAAEAAEKADVEGMPRQRGLFGASRMDAVRAEREEAAASLRNRMGVMRKADGKAGSAAIPGGGGAPLPAGVRSKMEPRLGADLSGVRMHNSGESAEAASNMGARAFTVGNDVHFGAGEFAPGTKEGDKLIAHELTHVVQGQRSGIQRKAEEGGDAKAPGGGGGGAAHGDDGGKAHGDHGGAAGGGAAGGGAAHGGEHGHEVSQPGEPAEKEADDVADKVADDIHGEAKADGEDDKKDGGKGKKGGPGKKEGAEEKAADGAHGDDKGAAAHGVAAAAHGGGGGGAGGGGGGHDAGPKAAGGSALGPAQSGPAAAGGGGAAPAGEQKAPAIAAKLMPGRKIFRTPGANHPNQPPPNGGGGPPNANANANQPPPDPYQAFCKTLPPDLQGPALALNDPAQRAAIQNPKVGLAFARAFLALRQPSSRLEMATLTWDQNSYLQTMALLPDEIAMYESLDAAKKVVWRDQLTPDERKDAKKMPAAGLTKLLTLPPELQTWRTLRVKAVIGPDVSSALTAAGENIEQIVDALSSSRGGDRLRRILMDPQLTPAIKSQFMRDVKAKLPTAPDPFEAMKQCQPQYKLLGNDASKDGKFATMEILKAMPIVNFANYGSIPPAKIAEACKDAPPSDASIPRKSGAVDMPMLLDKLKDAAVAKDLGKKYFPSWARQNLGNLSGCEVDIVGGRGGLPAYWTYDAKAGMTLGMPANDVAGALAVDENPAYQTGGVIVGLPQAMKDQFAASKQIRRPTAIDGLAFDQFQIVEDPNQCFGITAGQMGEVVVGPTKFSQTTPKRVF